MTAHWHQRKKISSDLAFDSTLLSGVKVFTYFLFLTLVCRGTLDQRRYLPKNSSSFVRVHRKEETKNCMSSPNATFSHDIAS